MTDRRGARRRSGGKLNTKTRTKETITVSIAQSISTEQQAGNEPSVSSTTASLSYAELRPPEPEERKKRSRKVRKAFDAWIRATLDKGVHGLCVEYLRAERMVNSNEVTNFRANNVNGRNRSPEVGCLDTTRVLLKNDPNHNDYINANYIETARRPRRFIITQAPLDTTTVDFWRMIQGERVDSIVMLCDFFEGNKSKSAVYFPREKGEHLQFENFEVVNQDVKLLEELEKGTEIRVSRLKLSSRTGSQCIFHYHWAHWADRKAPKDTRALLRLLREVRYSKSPIVVHCSTGVGRSGTLVAVEMVLEQLIKGDNASTDSMLHDLRKQRAYAISTDLQYVFVHHAVLLYLEGRKPLRGELKPKAVKFHEDYEKLVRQSEHLK
ncbi:hypothetical protein M3Y99_01913600 [Aphelenchoides fujianensis]|nr:hypothetical protein M3Y99_01913600 [Aphelenchoides fujianensis]